MLELFCEGGAEGEGVGLGGAVVEVASNGEGPDGFVFESGQEERGFW